MFSQFPTIQERRVHRKFGEIGSTRPLTGARGEKGRSNRMRVRCTIRQVRACLLWIALAAMVASSSGALAVTNPFAEVPDGHWSYRALTRLEELGLIQPRLTGGNQLMTRLTRVELAIEVAQALEYMIITASGSTDTLQPRFVPTNPSTLVAAYNVRVAEEYRLTEADRQLFADLVSTYRPELEALGYHFDSGLSTVGLRLLREPLGQLEFPSVGTPSSKGQVSSVPKGVSLGESFRLQPPGLKLNVDTAPAANGEAVAGGFRLIPNPTVPTTLSVGDDVVSRFGGLAGIGWDELALNAPESLLGMDSGVALGQLGSTVLVARRGSGDTADYVAGLDGAIVLDRLTLGATVLRSVVPLPSTEASADEKRDGTIAGVQGSYRLTPGILVTAGLASSIWDGQDAGLMHVGGVLEFSDTMSLRATYRLEQSGFRTFIPGQELDDDAGESESDRLGFDLAFDLGYARLTAGLGFEGDPEENARIRRQLGFDIMIPRTNVNLKLGYALIESFSERTELGLEYLLSNGSVELRYSVIDPGAAGNPSDTTEANWDAAITIRF